MRGSTNNLYSIHISTAKSWRGGENQIFLLARGLQQRGQKVLIVAPKGAPLLERCQALNIPVHAINSGMLNTLRLSSLLRRESPDIVHLHDSHAVLNGYLAALPLKKKSASRAGVRVIAHRRTVFDLRGKWKYSGRIDKVVAISEAVRERLISGGLKPESIGVVHSGLEFPEPLAADSDAAASFRKHHGIPSDAFVVAHAAALTSEKRQCDIIDAVARVRHSLNDAAAPPVHLVLAGTGDEEANLRARAVAQGVEKFTHFCGFVRDLRPLWATASLAIFASEAEGLCTALIEAQGAGLPAVITRAGGMLEVVEDHRTGLSVGIGDIAGLSEAILKLIQDKEMRRKMGSRARQRMKEKFSADAMVEGIDRLYREA